MKAVISLDMYRMKRRRLYLQQHRSLIDESIQFFIRQNFHSNFDHLESRYLAVKSLQNEMAWDYYDFRESLKEAINEVFGKQLLIEISRKKWFDSKFLGQEELIDRCLSLFVLGPAVSGLSE
ncbi:MAG: hypothetical protein ACOH5I_02250 [Oligoflexus sp.]